MIRWVQQIVTSKPFHHLIVGVIILVGFVAGPGTNSETMARYRARRSDRGTEGLAA